MLFNTRILWLQLQYHTVPSKGQDNDKIYIPLKFLFILKKKKNPLNVSFW